MSVSPVQLPLHKKLTRLVRLMAHIIEKTQLLLVASSLAYTTILSIIPALAVSFAIFHAFGGLERAVGTIQPFILTNLAHGSGQEVVKTLENFLTNVHASTMGVTGLIGLILTSMSMLSSFEQAINRVWGVTQKRPFFNRLASYWFFITLGPLGLSVAIGMVSSTQKIESLHFIPSSAGLYLAAFCAYFFVFKFIPNTRVETKPAVVSALITALSWILAKIGFGIYTKTVLTYSKIYGSLGAIPLVLLWIYVCWVVTLFGAAFTVTLQRLKLTDPEAFSL